MRDGEDVVLYPLRLARPGHAGVVKYAGEEGYRNTSLIRNSPPLGPYCRPMPWARLEPAGGARWPGRRPPPTAPREAPEGSRSSGLSPCIRPSISPLHEFGGRVVGFGEWFSYTDVERASVEVNRARCAGSQRSGSSPCTRPPASVQGYLAQKKSPPPSTLP